MRRFYSICRWTGYACGVVGIVLLHLGLRAQPPRPVLQSAGSILLLVMFVSFLMSYILYIAARMRRRGGPREEDVAEP